MSARVFLIAVMAAVIGACSSGGVDGTVSIPTNPESEFTQLAGLEGRLRGGVLRGESCLWLEVNGAPVGIVWPHGYRARFDPPRLVEPGGDVVAWDGQQLSLSGGVTTGPTARCATGASAFSAGAVHVTG